MSPPDPAPAPSPAKAAHFRCITLSPEHAIRCPRRSSETPAVIPRYQRILFAILLGSSLLMAFLLVYLHRRNFADVKNADNTPLQAPVYSATEDAVLLFADDSEGRVKSVTRALALPQQSALRARALLDHLLAEYTLPHAAHSINGGIAVDDVYLVPLPLSAPSAAISRPGVFNAATPSASSRDADTDTLMHSPGELAVINLRSSWVDAHPSGITSETLTIQSIVGTLHANLPEITAVRFLVDGKPRETLAGNIELNRTYDPLEMVQTAP